MKNSSLMKLMPVLNGVLLRGNADFIVNHVYHKKQDKFTNNTLVFYRKNMKIPLNLKSCVIVTSNKKAIDQFPTTYTIVYVKKVWLAYRRFITYYRKQVNIPVIGVTGTCGKTTTKEMIAHILSFKMNIVKTVLSQNGLSNNIKYLLQINDQTDAAVIEMGVSTTGHIRQTARYFKPTIGIITTIGTDHLQGFTDHHSYLKEKESMLLAVSKKGTMILNADDENTKKINKRIFKGEIIYIGEAEHSDFQLVNVRYHEDGMKFVLRFHGQVYFGFVPGFGKHNVYNAVFAIAAANLLGISINTSIKRLETFQPVKRHLQLHTGINGSSIIDDTWNTNPTSIQAAIEVLAELSKGKKSIAILGDIEELGQYSITEHQKVGEIVYKHKIDYLMTIGDQAKEIAVKAKELGMNSSNIFPIVSDVQLVKLLKKLATKNTIILVKTSMRKSYRDLMLKIVGQK